MLGGIHHHVEIDVLVAVDEDVTKPSHVAELGGQIVGDPAAHDQTIEQLAVRCRLAEPLVGDDVRGRTAETETAGALLARFAKSGTLVAWPL